VTDADKIMNPQHPDPAGSNSGSHLVEVRRFGGGLRYLSTVLIWSYKILFGLVHLNSDHFFELSPNQTRGHGFKLYKQFSSSTVRSSFFAQRVVNV